MSEIIIENLATCPELVDQVAGYWQAEWSSDKGPTGFETQKRSIEKNLNTHKAPFILVAYTEPNTLRACLPAGKRESRSLVGTAALFLHDLDSRPDLSPWMGGIFTAPEYRGRGIAKNLIEKVLCKAQELGYHTIYLHTEHTAGLYTKLGWQKLCDTITDQGEQSEIYFLNID